MEIRQDTLSGKHEAALKRHDEYAENMCPLERNPLISPAIGKRFRKRLTAGYLGSSRLIYHEHQLTSLSKPSSEYLTNGK